MGTRDDTPQPREGGEDDGEKLFKDIEEEGPMPHGVLVVHSQSLSLGTVTCFPWEQQKDSIAVEVVALGAFLGLPQPRAVWQHLHTYESLLGEFVSTAAFVFLAQQWSVLQGQAFG